MRRLLLCLTGCLVLIADSSSREPAPPPELVKVEDKGEPLPNERTMERLAKTNPIGFLENCIRRYDREVKSYTTQLRKQERLDGKLERSELIDVAFREEPFSVRLKWLEGARRASATLYVRGENNDQLLVVPSGPFSFVGIVKRDPNGSDAKKAGRYPLTEFGIKIGMQRTLTSWLKANQEDALQVHYLGQKRIKEAGDRLCWILRRTGYKHAEEDAISELTIYVDTETWLQVGSIIKGSEGQLIGEYFFRNVHLNPQLPPDTFTPEGLKK
jgi:hypothetical protein